MYCPYSNAYDPAGGGGFFFVCVYVSLSCYYLINKLPNLLLALQLYRLKIWSIRDVCSTHNV